MSIVPDQNGKAAGGAPQRTALVLSAGGMFGAYQAGAWRALERTLKPDLVIGVSAGSLNGWMIASGASSGDLAEEWLSPESSRMMRIASPRGWHRGLLDPNPLRERVERLTRRWTPRIPLAVLTFELRSRKVRIHHGPDLGAAHLLASSAVLLSFPPVRLNGRLHGDGGVLGALPLWPAAVLGATRIVAIDVFPRPRPWILRGVLATLGALCPRSPQVPLPEAWILSPPALLGSAKDAAVWNEEKIRSWIDQGESDTQAAIRALAPPHKPMPTPTGN